MTTRLHRILVLTGATLLALALSASMVLAQGVAPTSAASYLPPTDSMSGQSMLELILRTNREAIRRARVTVAETRDPETRRLAESLIGEHSAIMSAANGLWDRLNLTRADSTATTLSLPSPDSGLGAGVPIAGDSASDRAYAASQVTALETLLTQLRQRGPMVQDPAVRTFAGDLTATIERELATARRLAEPPAPSPAPDTTAPAEQPSPEPAPTSE